MSLRITLDGLKTLSYNCHDVDLLTSINEELLKTMDRFKQQLPSSEGLVVRPAAIHRAKRALKKARKQSRLLESTRGRPRTNPKYRNRVGKRALKYRKVC